MRIKVSQQDQLVSIVLTHAFFMQVPTLHRHVIRRSVYIGYFGTVIRSIKIYFYQSRGLFQAGSCGTFSAVETTNSALVN